MMLKGSDKLRTANMAALCATSTADEAGRRAKKTWQLFATKTFVVTKAFGKIGPRSAIDLGA